MSEDRYTYVNSPEVRKHNAKKSRKARAKTYADRVFFRLSEWQRTQLRTHKVNFERERTRLEKTMYPAVATRIMKKRIAEGMYPREWAFLIR